MDSPESVESDVEEEGHPDNEDSSQKGADIEEEGEGSCAEEEQQENTTVDEEDWHTCSEDEEEAEKGTSGSSNEPFHNSSRLLHKDELLNMFKSVHNGPKCKEGQLTVGLVGKKFCLYIKDIL